ncbi:hypothetical protein LZ32DRAFT_203004 [Colletotrichum eremochloae]|nr:hypothetical protein LZ32DRAFT_203004 [Colletotrichum eremochloae]
MALNCTPPSTQFGLWLPLVPLLNIRVWLVTTVCLIGVPSDLAAPATLVAIAKLIAPVGFHKEIWYGRPGELSWCNRRFRMPWACTSCSLSALTGWKQSRSENAYRKSLEKDNGYLLPACWRCPSSQGA